MAAIMSQPLPEDRALPEPEPGDLKSPGLIYLKGGLFLGIGLLSAGLLAADTGSIRDMILLGWCVWSFCRLYYFAFYVIEHYVDPGYRFAGLGSFFAYLLRKKRK
jgi:tellurite resistance protein TehA-like permease